jgi:hypothetical protein
MPSYNFQSRFAPLVQSGVKRNTIRGRAAQVGQTAYLFTGQRTRTCKSLGKGVIQSCRPITLGWREHGYHPTARVDSLQLNAPCMQELAVSEGFADAREMVTWFETTYKQRKPLDDGSCEIFSGFLISWEPIANGVAA